jgi:hypothetical protein
MKQQEGAMLKLSLCSTRPNPSKISFSFLFDNRRLHHWIQRRAYGIRFNTPLIEVYLELVDGDFSLTQYLILDTDNFVCIAATVYWVQGAGKGCASTRGIGAMTECVSSVGNKIQSVSTNPLGCKV